MNIQKPEGLLGVLPIELASSSSSRQLIINQDQQDEEASDCPLLTPSPPATQPNNALEDDKIFVSAEGNPVESIPPPTLENINKEDGLNEFMNIVNSSSRTLNDEPSSRDPMVESTTSGSSSDTNGPVCAQLLTQLNTAYQHLAPDAQALVSIRRKIAGNAVPCSWETNAASRDKPGGTDTETVRRWLPIVSILDTPKMGVSTWFISGN
ncbi:hypothetical protein K0M31_002828 [Melipona bicolor]|uniref:Uncharacterized protein n=1 Tax=Melipona bicolor TaxID=60889 RepID=A0AA40G0E0_9HYME|nr:hypothetical protein K0M31_002828 [Melipona bicolor]